MYACWAVLDAAGQVQRFRPRYWKLLYFRQQGDKAVVQVAFDIPVSGPNGLGGVTVSGSTSDYRQSVDKKGNIRVSMNVIGTGISAQVYINLPNGGNQASVDISPNFNSRRITLRGELLPLSEGNIFQGRTF